MKRFTLGNFWYKHDLSTNMEEQYHHVVSYIWLKYTLYMYDVFRFDKSLQKHSRLCIFINDVIPIL